MISGAKTTISLKEWLDNFESAIQQLENKNPQTDKTVPHYGDEYFETAKKNYLKVISIVKKYVDKPLQLLSALSTKNKDIFELNELLTEIDLRRFVPRIFHPFFAEDKKRFFMRGHEACYQLSKVIAEYLQQLQNKVQGGTFYNEAKDLFGHKLAKIRASLANRIERYETNQNYMAVRNKSDLYLAEIQKMSNDSENSKQETSTAQPNLDRLQQILGESADLPVAVPEFLLDETKITEDHSSYENEQPDEGTQHYISGFKTYLKKYDQSKYNEDQFVYDGTNARNVYLNSIIYSNAQDIIRNLDKNSRWYEENKEKIDKINETFAKFKTKLDLEIERLGTAKELCEWAKTIHDDASQLIKMLEAFRNFNPKGHHIFKKASEVKLHTLGKEAFDQLAPLNEMTRAYDKMYQWALEELFHKLAVKLMLTAQNFQYACQNTPELKNKPQKLEKAVSSFIENLNKVSTWESYKESKKGMNEIKTAPRPDL